MKNTTTGLIKLTALLLLASPAFLAGQRPTAPSGDWPQWRGPNRDGSAPSFTIPKAWPEKLTERWKVEVGIGYATPVIVHERPAPVYVVPGPRYCHPPPPVIYVHGRHGHCW